MESIHTSYHTESRKHRVHKPLDEKKVSLLRSAQRHDLRGGFCALPIVTNGDRTITGDWASGKTC